MSLLSDFLRSFSRILLSSRCETFNMIEIYVLALSTLTIFSAIDAKRITFTIFFQTTWTGTMTTFLVRVALYFWTKSIRLSIHNTADCISTLITCGVIKATVAVALNSTQLPSSEAVTVKFQTFCFLAIACFLFFLIVLRCSPRRRIKIVHILYYFLVWLWGNWVRWLKHVIGTNILVISQTAGTTYRSIIDIASTIHIRWCRMLYFNVILFLTCHLYCGIRIFLFSRCTACLTFLCYGIRKNEFSTIRRLSLAIWRRVARGNLWVFPYIC